MIANGAFSPHDPGRFRQVRDSLLGGGDPFFVIADFAAYLACQERVDALYGDVEEWTREAVLNVAGMGYFSSDRAVLDYAAQVWGAVPVAPQASL